MDQTSYSAGGNQPVTVIPTPSTPKTIGLLNVIFGALLVLCALCWAIQLLAQSALAPMMSAQFKQAQEQMEQQRKRRIEELQAEEEAAETEDEKARLKSLREQLESQRTPAMPDMSKMYGMGDPRVIAYSYIDLISGLVLNLLLIATGIGLMQFREWGRRGALWIAGIKIARLVLLEGIFVFAITPIMAEQTAEVYREMGEQMKQNMPPGQAPPIDPFTQMGNVMWVICVGMAIGVVVLGVIYPAIVLWALTRPGAKAACR